jgi:microcystin degradation protein MlrC
MRIAFGGIATESCTFSPWPTQLGDFTVKRGAEMLTQGRYPFFGAFPATFLPTLYASALPGGPVVREAYQQLKQELVEQLRQLGTVDGFYLDLHGAMNVLGIDDAEADLATAIRNLVGPDCLIAASMDLHGNISQQYIEQIDMLTAYRTAPHIDTIETRQKACTMLVRCLQEGRRPQLAWQPVPVILPGERTSTEVEPAASLYAQLAEVDQVPGVLDASIFVGYVWADEPRSSAAVIVIGFDREVIEREASRLAQAYWEARRRFTFWVPAGTIDQCLEWALAAPETPVFISDSGDNPTAGGVGDTSIFLERLLVWQVPSAVMASIPDAVAVQVCQQAGLGEEVKLSLGGKLDPIHSRPLPVTGRVLHLTKADPVGGDIAVVQVDQVKVIITERRKPFHYIAEFEKLGIDPSAHKVVVVKIGYLVPDLKQAAPRALLALSPGAVDQAIERLPFKRVRRPMYPLDPDTVWQPI